MADLLIKHLKEKANDHSDLTLLVNQWGFDEELIPKALQSVGNLFPHYSRHDESHSKQILINIERLLGNENISKLTATDTWLLLEAAYWHDIGMVVPQSDIEDAFKDKDFKRYIEEIKDTPKHDLHLFCLGFDLTDVNNCFKGAATPLDAIDKFRQLMAEWFRRKHAERSNEIVQAPWESVGLSSPRTELIPTRLFKLLGRVCLMHGLPFENIIHEENGLPFKEAGLAQEDCHPRFIACLLRMGDLLDLDDNRFCPVMQRIAGDNRPKLSKSHEEKHAAIRHLRIDRNRIEISAECESVDGYLETYKWFGWLEQEIQNQLVHWQDIVPTREYGLLPTLGGIKVKLSGEQQLLNEGKKPQFSMDREQATTLLQGSNLYESKFACIRELLQNAVDATLLGLWLIKEDIKWDNPLSEDVDKELHKALVEIFITETPSEDIPSDKTRWTLKITDKGTGISKEDLSYMLKIGGSRKNRSKHERINQMPEWMKPSGTFGIGFQSAFMISDKVKLTTKSLITNEILEVEMYSPTGDKEGLVTIKNLKDNFSQSAGTTLEMTFLLDKKSSKWSIGLFDESLSSKLVNNHDPILDDTFPYDSIKLFEEVAKFSQNTLIPIKSHYKSSGDDSSVINSLPDIDKTDKYFVKVGEQQLLLTYEPLFGEGSVNNFFTLYRGQPFEHKLSFINHISVAINLLSGKAGGWLTINRDKLSESSKSKIIKLTYEALKKQIGIDLRTEESFDSDTKKYLSFFLKYIVLYVDESWKSLSDQLPNQWQRIEFGSDETSSYKHFSDKEEWVMSTETNKQTPVASGTPKDEKDCDLLLHSFISSNHRSHIRAVIMEEWLKDSSHSVQVLESSFYDEGFTRFRYKLSSTKTGLYTEKALATRLARAINIQFYNVRYVIEDIGNNWDVLVLKKDFSIYGMRPLFDVPSKNENNILLPFIFYYRRTNSEGASIEVTEEQLDKLVKKIQPKLKNTKATFVEVKKAYQDLIEYIDELMKKSPFKDDWENARSQSPAKMTKD